MKENKDISAFDDIFKQQLENASATPPAGVWEGISSSLASTGAATVTTAVVKTALWVKIGIGVIAAAAIASVVYIAGQKNETALQAPVKVSEQAQESVLPQERNAEINDISEIINPAPSEKTGDKQAVSKTDIVSKYEDAPEVGIVPPAKTDEQAPVEYKINLQKEEKPLEMKGKEQPVKADSKVSPAEADPIAKSETPLRKVDSSVITVPNVFTPDGDGINDDYKILIRGEESVRIIIYDINETNIFETTNKYLGWNCTKLNGEPYPAGTYIVKVIYKFPGKPVMTKIDQLKLIR